jgi:HK97 family phage prohead protease
MPCRQPSAMSDRLLSSPFRCKSVQEAGRFGGYASVFYIEDSQNDMVLPGAFAEAEEGGRPVKLLWQHRHDAPIGVVDTLKEDGYGLYMEAALNLDVAQGREAYALLRSGAVNGLSIGYQARESEYDHARGVRLLTSVRLWEVSLVTFPSNEMATVRAVKGSLTVRDAEQALREAGFSRTEAKRVAASGFSGKADGAALSREETAELCAWTARLSAEMREAAALA